MKRTQVDSDGTVHCPKCGAIFLGSQRNAGAILMFGVGGVLANSQIKCNGCGALLKPGKPPPRKVQRENRRIREAHQVEQARVADVERRVELSRLAQVAEEEKRSAREAKKRSAPGAGCRPPAGWYQDQQNLAMVRWFDGRVVCACGRAFGVVDRLAARLSWPGAGIAVIWSKAAAIWVAQGQV